MATTHAITAATLTPIIWMGERVITTERLAKLYGTEPINIQVNHSRNADRFEAGKHYFKLFGDDLKNLRVTLSKSQISPKARSMIFWTERGAMRHAKMLETDAAWDVFETLEDCYFRQRATSLEPADAPSTVRDRSRLLHRAVDMNASRGISIPRAYKAMSRYTGVRSLPHMSKGDVSNADSFGARYVAGSAAPGDFTRIERNTTKLEGEAPQLGLFPVEGDDE
ncbi:ORF6N domain-containing protein [Paraburkholderia adhaesiva]|uniref:ORF6N domain-containing protein n=1 Tax=Paraburkholderia adhaesiva TaxID=2883244 RepID=UPI001F452395|nr:ORF6N domain-containing protein [Paraburkholderia adhaesiva]